MLKERKDVKMEQPNFNNQTRPKSPFATMDGLPKEVKIIQKQLKELIKNQKIQQQKIQSNNEAFVILNKQIQYLTTELQMMNYYLSLFVTMQQYMISDKDLDEDAQILRETVEQVFRKQGE